MSKVKDYYYTDEVYKNLRLIEAQKEIVSLRQQVKTLRERLKNANTI